MTKPEHTSLRFLTEQEIVAYRKYKNADPFALSNREVRQIPEIVLIQLLTEDFHAGLLNSAVNDEERNEIIEIEYSGGSPLSQESLKYLSEQHPNPTPIVQAFMKMLVRKNQ